MLKTSTKTRATKQMIHPPTYKSRNVATIRVLTSKNLQFSIIWDCGINTLLQHMNTRQHSTQMDIK
uniref:Uncharacterized protein n=1 Tax=Cucumis melo TaxID=3656 RepID=A0A9I9EFV5_CUCME